MTKYIQTKWRPVSTHPVKLLTKLQNARKQRRVIIAEDIFAPDVTDARIDLIFAVMCSLPWHRFVYETKHKKRRRSWNARVKREGRHAVRLWLKKQRESFLRNCDVSEGSSRCKAEQIWDARHQTGYHSTPAPTAPVLFIYNEAAKQAPDERPWMMPGTFVGPMMCWRAWPLNNVLNANTVYTK